MALKLKTAQETGLFRFLFKEKLRNEDKHFKLQEQGILEPPDCLQT